MPSSLSAELLKRNPSKQLVIGCAIDGSNISDKALQVACGMVQERRDRLVLLHVADQTKTYLPRHLQPKHLESSYVDKAFGFRVKAEWACRDKGTASTCEALMQLAQEQHIDLLVVGSFGRKGERVDMLGTVSDFSLREGHSSIAIVRSTAVLKAPGERLFLFATDGSKGAAAAFSRCATSDRVLLVSCGYDHQAESGPDCFKSYKELAASLNIACEALTWRLERTQSVADGLLQLVALRDADTLVLGISIIFGQKKLGSVSDELTHKATHCNTIVIKNAYEAQSQQYATAGARGLSSMILPAGNSKDPILYFFSIKIICSF